MSQAMTSPPANHERTGEPPSLACQPAVEAACVYTIKTMSQLRGCILKGERERNPQTPWVARCGPPVPRWCRKFFPLCPRPRRMTSPAVAQRLSSWRGRSICCGMEAPARRPIGACVVHWNRWNPPVVCGGPWKWENHSHRSCLTSRNVILAFSGGAFSLSPAMGMGKVVPRRRDSGFRQSAGPCLGDGILGLPWRAPQV